MIYIVVRVADKLQSIIINTVDCVIVCNVCDLQAWEVTAVRVAFYFPFRKLASF